MITTNLPLTPQPVALATPQPTLPARQVTVVVDACCEMLPERAAELGIVLLPRAIRADGRETQLGAERTLHADCWPQPPKRLVVLPQQMSLLATAYTTALHSGMAVLAIGLPSRLDNGTRQAQAVRSVLLAGSHSVQAGRRRIGVVEASHIGHSLGSVVEIAGRAAAAGLALHQVVMLIDQIQAATRSWILTSGSPQADTRLPEGRWTLRMPGEESLWSLDHNEGLFTRKAGGRGLARRLFDPAGPLHAQEAQAFGTGQSSLLASLNKGRAAQSLDPLDLQRGGLSLLPFFGRGSVELAALLPADYVDRIHAVIQRVEGPAPTPQYGVRQRGGL